VQTYEQRHCNLARAVLTGIVEFKASAAV